MSDDPGLTVDRLALQQLAALLLDRVGLKITPDGYYGLRLALLARMPPLGISDATEYVRRLRQLAGEAELRALLPLVTVGKTEFFRDARQFQALEQKLIPQMLSLARREGRKLQIWSAGCATGEEPYSLAMVASERGAHPADLEIWATDLNPVAVETATAGWFPTRRMVGVSEERLARCFVPHEGGYRVVPGLKAMVRFEGHNLAAPVFPTLKPRSLDLILCRNVIIYFDQPTIRNLMDRFFEALRPGGVLLLGYSESLFRLATRFEMFEVTGSYAYRRPVPVPPPPPPRPSAANLGPIPQPSAPRPSSPGLIRQSSPSLPAVGDVPRSSRPNLPMLGDVSNVRPSSAGMPALGDVSNVRPSSARLPALGDPGTVRPSSSGMPALGDPGNVRPSSSGMPALGDPGNLRPSSPGMPALGDPGNVRPSSSGMRAIPTPQPSAPDPRRTPLERLDRVIALIEKGDFGQALLGARRLIDDQPEDLAALLTLGNIHALMGNVDEARDLFNVALSKEPLCVEARVYLAVAAIQSGDIEQARIELTRALFLEPTLALSHYLLAQVHEKRGDPEAARRAYKNAIAQRKAPLHALIGHFPELPKTNDAIAQAAQYRLAALSEA